MDLRRQRCAHAVLDAEQVGPAPRCFGLDPAGRFLFLAKQTSGNVLPYAIDQQKGTLSFVRAIHLGKTAPYAGAALVP